VLGATKQVCRCRPTAGPDIGRKSPRQRGGQIHKDGLRDTFFRHGVCRPDQAEGGESPRSNERFDQFHGLRGLRFRSAGVFGGSNWLAVGHVPINSNRPAPERQPEQKRIVLFRLACRSTNGQGMRCQASVLPHTHACEGVKLVPGFTSWPDC